MITRKTNKVTRLLTLPITALALIASLATVAKEGMFTPEQLPLIKKDLVATGLEIPPESLTSLTKFPMGAVVSLGGCSASFVSEQGLVVTNHHCARGSVQFNSTAENNYLENGFVAKSFDEELPAAPGSRIYVTVDFKDVTNDVVGSLSSKLTGRERYDAIDRNKKRIIAECEKDEGHRCSVPSFHQGLEYKLIKQLEIKDVRIAYSPADSVGKYGGDIDNWMWPRHTGDFAFYRAYVGKDGKPADFSKDNVPFKPEHTLKVSAAGLDDGDFVMAAGYPGRTQRYQRLVTVEHVFGWSYPQWVSLIEQWIGTIERVAPEGSDARVKYESLLAGLNNFMKNTKGQLKGAKRVGLVERRAQREAELLTWIGDNKERQHYRKAISALDELETEISKFNKASFLYDNATRSQMLSAAKRLYRLAIEKQKPDAERESGYQERDFDRIKQSLQRIDRRFDAGVEQALWLMFIEKYAKQDKSQRVTAFDKHIGLNAKAFNKDKVAKRLASFYQKTELNNVDKRIALMDASVADLEASKDPFMQLAVATFKHGQEVENTEKVHAGKRASLRPQYMKAIIAWQDSLGLLAYPDANSTLRVTYGNVIGGSPKDGMIYEPFTRVEGIVEKDTGEEPFNSPKKQLELIKDKKYGDYALKTLGTVPVNFLTDLDSTGGNSGSATMNSKGELIGLLFDGTFESVNSDWDFDPRTTRTIHVDSRYMLWVMEYVDDAKHLVDEMDIVK
ncbi:S46 family peptidase [Thalassotalea sp. M1531]|uniref:Dipeptidyl-peptidase n=1 Tax=Thalassotalea algicola TaxID=2716224 RepID=A0A7Y0LF34_9GAMM|nr:S46 family peptidase [Thalassotalea algicola]NMP33143.1 S46 family peptidase [Thalassotalea algicola]